MGITAGGSGLRGRGGTRRPGAGSPFTRITYVPDRRRGYLRARSPLMNGQPISSRMAWLSPVMSSTGL